VAEGTIGAVVAADVTVDIVVGEGEMIIVGVLGEAVSLTEINAVSRF